jgi:hypothetical protein
MGDVPRPACNVRRSAAEIPPGPAILLSTLHKFSPEPGQCLVLPAKFVTNII